MSGTTPPPLPAHRAEPADDVVEPADNDARARLVSFVLLGALGGGVLAFLGRITWPKTNLIDGSSDHSPTFSLILFGLASLCGVIAFIGLVGLGVMLGVEAALFKRDHAEAIETEA